MVTAFDDGTSAREMGRALTAELSPAELPFFDELIDANIQPKISRGDKTLAFGISPGDIGLAPILFEVGKIVLEGIWIAAMPVLAGIAQDVGADARSILSQRINDWINSHFRTPPPVTLSSEAVQDILKSVGTVAAAQGMDESQIKKLDATVSRALSSGKSSA